MIDPSNPTGLRGIEFVEFATDAPDAMDALWRSFGFSRVARHPHHAIDVYVQNDIRFLVNAEPNSFGGQFARAHGPSAATMGWRFDDVAVAFEEAIRRGARPYQGEHGPLALDVPAIYGIGDSLILFLGPDEQFGVRLAADFTPHPAVCLESSKGFTAIDHLTNNVRKGTMQQWADFYRDIFGFTDVRNFEIRGEQTGLTSYALRSPDGSFCIPINEGDESKSQIEEYLREYQGPGIQHIALMSDDLLASLDQMADSAVETLDIDAEYYAEVFHRVPNVVEDHDRIERHQVLVDGDEEGYLLQIFTRNLVGPIFIELIQRKNHLSFGEGNFGALFRSIERDQERRGVL
jgi:4-hydroxyphenylpyruvate dioxygenase